jgi:hypothetical protein
VIGLIFSIRLTLSIFAASGAAPICMCGCVNRKSEISLGCIAAPTFNKEHVLLVVRLDLLHQNFEEIGCAHRCTCPYLAVKGKGYLLCFLIKWKNQLELPRFLAVKNACSGQLVVIRYYYLEWVSVVLLRCLICFPS